MKEAIAIIALSVLVAILSVQLVTHRDDTKEAERKRNRDYKFVDITIGCECGGKLRLEIPDFPGLWPVEITCGRCFMKYVMTRTVQ